MDFDERFAQLLAVAMVCTAQAVQAIAGLLTLFFIFGKKTEKTLLEFIVA